MADLLFAKYTNAILDSLPYWFHMRKKSKDSIGARFLNISGLELDDIEYVLDYAYKQCYITSADITQVDFCYKVVLPMPLRTDNIEAIFANGAGLMPAKNLKQFFGVDLKGVTNNTIHSFEYYYIDKEFNIVYVRQKYNADIINNDGKITIKFKKDSEENDSEEYIFRLVPHHVWNFFDEIGALVSCPRIFEEPNFEYKERILDVFKNKASSSKNGLMNGIARELALRREVHWENPKYDLELEDAMIVLNSIKINGQYADPKRIFLTKSGTVLIKGYGYKIYYDVIVSYIHGLEMHQLFNTDDIKLYNELFTIEGKAKPKLKQYIDILNSESPIFWNHFHWNEHYWNQNEPDVSGVGFIPHLYDGSIRGFINYKSDRS